MPQYVPFIPNSNPFSPATKLEISQRLRTARAWFSGMPMNRPISQENPVSPPILNSAPPSEAQHGFVVLPDRLQAEVVIHAAVAEGDLANALVGIRTLVVSLGNLLGIQIKLPRLEYWREAGRGRDRRTHQPIRGSGHESGLIVAALRFLEHPVHAVGKISGTEHVNRSGRNLGQLFPVRQVLVVRLRQAGAVMCARNEGFQPKPSPDIE